MPVREIGPGLHPSEVVVEVQTTHGTEQLVIDRDAISNDSIFVGWRSLAQKNGELLVELPNETMSGTWRIWVRTDEVIADPGRAVGAV
jgi:hypothetical protein